MPGEIARIAEHYGLDERSGVLAVEYALSGDVKAAARAAGFEPDEAERRLVTDAALQNAIIAASVAMRARDLATARATVYELVRAAKSERVRLSAAQLLIEYALGRPVERHKHVHEDRRAPPDVKYLASRIRELSAQLGLSEKEVVAEAVAADEADPFSYTPDIPVERRAKRKAR